MRLWGLWRGKSSYVLCRFLPRWCLDVRYIEKHRISEIKSSFYVITVMDAFSRAVLSSDIFQSQDLSCVLIVLYAAIERFGAPKKLITDNGGVFWAK
jgi:transposase InsO family protein